MLSPKKDDDYISALLQLEESETLDFKQGINNAEKIAKTLAAFANTSGGKIVIGVSDNKQVLGIDEFEEMYMIEKAASEYCSPPVAIDFELYIYDLYNEKNTEFEEKNILIVIVSKSSSKHYSKNKNGEHILYKRVNDRTLPQNQD